MTEKNKGGRPALPDDEKAKVRSIRLTDAQQSDFKLVGWDAIRAWVKETAAKIRSQKEDY